MQRQKRVDRFELVNALQDSLQEKSMEPAPEIYIQTSLADTLIDILCDERVDNSLDVDIIVAVCRYHYHSLLPVITEYWILTLF